MDDSGTSELHVSEAYLAHIKSRGIDTLFINGGTDSAPLAEAYARRDLSKLDYPDVVVAPYESVAIGMAHGAYLATGKPQLAMVHVVPGTANSVGLLSVLAQERVPLVLTAGTSPIYEYGPTGARDSEVQWSQDVFYQAGIVRDFVKWHYELRSPLQMHSVIDRALRVALTPPAGPVYLTLPREVLCEAMTDRISLSPLPAVPTRPAPDPDAVRKLGRLVAAAKFPVIVAQGAGVDTRVCNALSAMSDRHAIGIVENGRPRYVNSDSNSCRYHLGFDTRTVYGFADLLIFLECEVPWVPVQACPRDDAIIVECGLDPASTRRPIKGHRCDLAITTDSYMLIEALSGELDHRKPVAESGRSADLERLAESNHRMQEASLTGLARDGYIDKAYLNSCLADLIDSETVVFSEYWVDSAVLSPRRPGSLYHCSSAGALGWALPAAIGYKREVPTATVVAAIGDGAYIFSNPAACHNIMMNLDLAVLVLIFNNQGWAAVDNSARRVFPDGAVAAMKSSSLGSLGRGAEYETYASASGGVGYSVTTRHDLRNVLERAIRSVRENKCHVVVNVHGQGV